MRRAIGVPDFPSLVSCPHALRASMITDGAVQAPAVIMDCRDEPGNDRRGVIAKADDENLS
jgi:hypothetical protein